jgi:hypothetical protein
MFGQLKNRLVSWEERLDFRPKLSAAVGKHEWALYPFFALLIVIFFLIIASCLSLPLTGLQRMIRTLPEFLPYSTIQQEYSLESSRLQHLLA